MDWQENEQEDEQEKEFVAFLRKFRPITPPTLTAVRLGRLMTPTTLVIAAAVLLACAIPVRIVWNHRASDDQASAATRESHSLPTSSTAWTTATEGPTQARQEHSTLSRALNLIPSVEATLSAVAPPATPQDRIRVTTLPDGNSSFAARAPAAPRRKVIVRVKPTYPPEAERLGLEAYVVLKLTVDPAGEVTGTQQINGVVNLRPDDENAAARVAFYAANPYAFDLAAEAAAKQWKFEAANSSMTCFMSFRFRLTAGPGPTKSDALPERSATRSIVPGSARPGFAVPSGPARVDGEVIKPPTRLVNVFPVYPEDAKAAGIQGVVILEITIGVDGSVTKARVLRSIPELDQAAIDAVLQWVYEPTLLNGVPVEVTSVATINFTLR